MATPLTMEIKEHHHLQLLLPPNITTTYHSDDTTFIDSRIPHRFLFIFFIATISIWANYQASQGFEIVIINDVTDTPSGRKFHLFFVSNDKATQIVLSTSKLAENVLYPDNNRQRKKPVSRVTIRLTNDTKVERETLTHDEYVLRISSSLMEESNIEKAMVLAVQRGMTRVWLWNGEGGAPEGLLDGMVEYVNLVGDLVKLPDYRLRRLPVVEKLCWKHWDGIEVANFLRYCEMKKIGFIGRLNRAMESSWHEQMVDDAQGIPTQQLCGSYYSTLSSH